MPLPLPPVEFVRSPEALQRIYTPAEARDYTRWLATLHYENFHVVSFLHQGGDQQPDRTREANPGGEPAEDLLPFGRRRPDQHAPHARGDYPATHQTHPERHRAGEPDHYDPR